VTNVRKLRSFIYLALLGTVGLIVVLVNPLYMLAVISMFAFFAIARQTYFNSIFMMLKRHAKNVSRLRFEIRAILHTGFRDYSDSIDSEESRRGSRTCGFVR
jgi:hypothetical protein